MEEVLRDVCVCICVCDEVMTELANQAPGQASSDQQRAEEDEDEECVYMFRYPKGSPKVSESVNHPESPATFLTVAKCVRVVQPEAMQPCDCERPESL